MSAVRVGVIGLGYWGPQLVRAFHEVEGAEVAWVCDTRPEKLHQVARRFPAVNCTVRSADLLEDRDLTAVAIATPVSTHYALATAALDAGKHVFVEKPLTASFADAIDLVERARARELVLMPGHTFLYSSPVVTIKELIAAGELGEIYFISSSRVNLGLHQPDVSVVWDLAPHDFSILRFWLDEVPSHVSATTRSCIIPGTPDVAFINLAFPSGTIAHVELSWLAPGKLRRTAIVGSRKMVVYDDTSVEPVRVFDSGVMDRAPETFGEYRLTYRTGDIVSPHIEAREPLVLELNDFCETISTGSALTSDASIGLEVVRMIEAVDLSLERAGGRVALHDEPATVRVAS